MPTDENNKYTENKSTTIKIDNKTLIVTGVITEIKFITEELPIDVEIDKEIDAKQYQLDYWTSLEEQRKVNPDKLIEGSYPIDEKQRDIDIKTFINKCIEMNVCSKEGKIQLQKLKRFSIVDFFPKKMPCWCIAAMFKFVKTNNITLSKTHNSVVLSFNRRKKTLTDFNNGILQLFNNSTFDTLEELSKAKTIQNRVTEYRKKP